MNVGIPRKGGGRGKGAGYKKEKGDLGEKEDWMKSCWTSIRGREDGQVGRGEGKGKRQIGEWRKMQT